MLYQCIVFGVNPWEFQATLYRVCHVALKDYQWHKTLLWLVKEKHKSGSECWGILSSSHCYYVRVKAILDRSLHPESHQQLQLSRHHNHVFAFSFSTLKAVHGTWLVKLSGQDDILASTSIYTKRPKIRLRDHWNGFCLCHRCLSLEHDDQWRTDQYLHLSHVHNTQHPYDSTDSGIYWDIWERLFRVASDAELLRWTQENHFWQAFQTVKHKIQTSSPACSSLPLAWVACDHQSWWAAEHWV